MQSIKGTTTRGRWFTEVKPCWDQLGLKWDQLGGQLSKCDGQILDFKVITFFSGCGD